MTKPRLKFEIYQDHTGEYRWRLRSNSNHKILADSGEGYQNKGDCTDAITLVCEGAEDAEVIEVASA